MKIDNKGMTLPELIMAMGISSFVILGGYKAYSVFTEYSKHADRVKNQKIMMKGLVKLGKRATRFVRISAFDIDRSYAYSTEDGLEKTLWDPMAVANAQSEAELTYNFMTEDKSERFLNLHNDSFTIELIKNSGRDADKVLIKEDDVDYELSFNSSAGIFISRCISKNDINKKFTIKDALELPRAPFGYFDEDSNFHVKCCKIKAESANPTMCSDGDIMANDSKWRTRIFQVNREIGLTQIPKKGDIRYFPSAGFTFFFNHPQNPKTYTLAVFSLLQSCQSKIDMGLGEDDCKAKRVLNREIISGTLNLDWSSSGIIKIDE